MKNLKDLTPEECILIANICVPEIKWKLIQSTNKWDGFDMIEANETEKTSKSIFQIDYRDESLLNGKNRFRLYHNLEEFELHQVNINYALEFIKKLTITKKLNREEMVMAILKKSKSKDTLLILAISETDFVEQIYCEMFNIE